MGLSKAINLFELSVIVSKLQLISEKTSWNLEKLCKLMWIKTTEALTWARCEVIDSFWQLIFWLVELLLPRVQKSFRDCDWMKKFPYEIFRAIHSIQQSQRVWNKFMFCILSKSIFAIIATASARSYLVNSVAGSSSVTFRLHLLRYLCLYTSP